MYVYFIYGINCIKPVPEAARSKAYVYGRSLAAIVGSNPTGGHGCLLRVVRGLCDELITCPEESYRPWRVVVCDQETSKNEEAIAHAGLQSHKKINSIKFTQTVFETEACCLLGSNAESFAAVSAISINMLPQSSYRIMSLCPIFYLQSARSTCLNDVTHWMWREQNPLSIEKELRRTTKGHDIFSYEIQPQPSTP
jgi:hypothetical protein